MKELGVDTARLFAPIPGLVMEGAVVDGTNSACTNYTTPLQFACLVGRGVRPTNMAFWANAMHGLHHIPIPMTAADGCGAKSW